MGMCEWRSTVDNITSCWVRGKYTVTKSVSLLLRDTLKIPCDNPHTTTTELAANDHSVCITDHKVTVRERVGDLLFDYQGGFLPK